MSQNSTYLLSVSVMEMTGSKGRLWGGVMYQACFASGFMIVSAMAYVIRDFRYLQLTIGLLVLLYVPYYWYGILPIFFIKHGLTDQ